LAFNFQLGYGMVQQRVPDSAFSNANYIHFSLYAGAVICFVANFRHFAKDIFKQKFLSQIPMF
jgi:hypothetical protein